VDIAKNVKPSERHEVEITSINQAYLELGELEVALVSNQNGWFDTGTFESMMEAANYVMANEHRTGSYIGSPDAVAFENGWIDGETKQLFIEWIKPQIKSGYGEPWKEFVSNSSR
jgi:glucose-1-phosphate thymidylyltransferase